MFKLRKFAEFDCDINLDSRPVLVGMRLPVMLPAIADRPVMLPAIADHPVMLSAIADRPVMLPAIADRSVMLPAISDHPVMLPAIADRPVMLPAIADRPVMLPAVADRPVMLPPLLTFLSYLSFVHTEKPECCTSNFELSVTGENLFHLLRELTGCSEPKFHDVIASTYRLT